MNESTVKKNINRINADYSEYGVDLRLDGGKVYLCGKSLDQWHHDMWIAIAKYPEIDVRHYIPNNLPLKIFNLFRKEFGVTNWCPDVFAGFYSEILNECSWCESCPLKHNEDSGECCDGLFEVYDDMDFNYACYPDKDNLELVKESALDMANHKWLWK